MDKSKRTKQAIVSATIALIGEENGDASQVTIRKIAARSEVSVGLIHHYFASKEVLIEFCVQQIISGVIRSFRPQIEDASNPLSRLKQTAKQVMDFLMDHREISRISILGDLAEPDLKDNTSGTIAGFASCVSEDAEPTDTFRLAFWLTSLMQVSFLRREVLRQSFGVDLNDKEQRDRYLDEMTTQLFGGIGK